MGVIKDQERLRVVDQLDRQNPGMSSMLSNYVEVAARVMDVDYSGIHFLTDRHQEIKSKAGLDLPRLPIEESVCQFTLEQSSSLVIQDLTADDRTSGFWYVKDNPCVKSYAAVPLETEEGHHPGTLCLLDRKTRSFTDEDVDLLNSLAEEVIQKLQMNASLKKYRKEAEKNQWMIREIHHRLKNNLAVVSGLMDLEAMRIENAEASAVLDSMQKRLRSIADVHRRLYESESFDNMDILGYARDLVKSINKSYRRDKKDIEYRVKGDHFTIGEEKAVTMGLLLNELVTNAYKHAFEASESGVITVTLQHEEQENDYRLVVEDDGKGMSEDFDPESSETLGFRLFETLVDQLDGTYTIDTKPDVGTRVTVTFRSTA